MRKFAAILFFFFVISATAYAQDVPVSAGSAHGEQWGGATRTTFPASTGTGAGGIGVDVTAGELILCAESGTQNNPASPCTDSLGNSFTLITGSRMPASGGGTEGIWSYSVVTNAGNSDVVSGNWNGGSSFVAVVVHVYSKSSGSWVQDVTAAVSSATQSGTSGTLGTVTFTTDSPTEAVDCTWVSNVNGNVYTPGLIGGLTPTSGPVSAGSAGAIGDEYVITSSPVTNAGASMTYGSSTNGIQGSCVSFSSVALTPPVLTVDAATGHHPINPLIYGQGGLPPLPQGPQTTFGAKAAIAIYRWGGDATSNYNWQLNNTNTGTDYWFVSGGSSAPPPYNLDTQITTYKSAVAGTKFLVTIPINPYLTSTTAPACSYLQSQFPSDTFTQTNNITGIGLCGNGYTSTGYVPAVPTDIGYNYTSNSTTIQKAWIAHLIATFGNCASGTGVCYFQLDNEPGGYCGGIHYDWGGTISTCASGLYGTIESWGETYLTAIKQADPSGVNVLGPSDYAPNGWVAGSPTADPAVVYYLKQMAADGVPLDYLDEHWGVGDNSEAASNPTAAIQYDFDQVRSWWDPTYNYPGGTVFAPFATQNVALGLSNNTELIPRMQAYIAAFNPSVKGFTASEWEISSMNPALALTNGSGTGYSVGSHGNLTSSGCNNVTFTVESVGAGGVPASVLLDSSHSSSSAGCAVANNVTTTTTSGGGAGMTLNVIDVHPRVGPDAASGNGTNLIDALAVTDALGVFGQQNLQLSALFNYVSDGDAASFAYYLYRNYDSASPPTCLDGFGSNSVTAASNYPAQMSVYAATRPCDGALTVIVVNKEPLAYTSPISLSGYSPMSTVQVYSYSSANLSAIQHTTAAAATVTGGGYPFPAYSATEFVFMPTGGSTSVEPPSNVLATVQQ